jgi:hypothetical protein
MLKLEIKERYYWIKNLPPEIYGSTVDCAFVVSGM